MHAAVDEPKMEDAPVEHRHGPEEEGACVFVEVELPKARQVRSRVHGLLGAGDWHRKTGVCVWGGGRNVG